MIDDMITRLLEETNQESEQKGFCDKELGTNQKTRTKLQMTIDGLTAQIDENDATITATTQRIAELSKELTALRESMKEATTLRGEEKAKNAATVKDAQDALHAIESATAVLKDFYEKASSATALLQEDSARPAMGSAEWNALANPNFKGTVDKGHKEGMQTFGKKYTGMQDEAGGVFAMLEVISSDFSTLEADTKSSEAEAARTYKNFMADSQKAVAVKEKEAEMNTADKVSANSDKQSNTKDLKATQDQLLAADRYYEKLKPQCVDSGVSYADRVKAREEEIQSLKEALTILEGQ
jgi:chromosome segregation ATPase